MSDITRKIGTHSIYFDRDSHTVYVTFEMPFEMPDETYKITLTNSEDALTCYWVCCNTAKAQQEFSTLLA